ncbi:MAG: CAAX prenyl protease-related protein, partial [Terriglobia bacterium]
VPYIMPLLAVITIGMVIRPFSENLRYPLQTVGGLFALWYCSRTALLRLRWAPSLGAISIGLLVCAIWFLVRRQAFTVQIAGLSVIQPAAPAILPGASWNVFRLLGAVLIEPVVEEMAFRGYLLRRLIAADFDSVAQGRFTWVSFLGSSIVFGLLHQQWYLGIFAGMAFAAAIYQRGRLSDAILSHVLANGLLATSIFFNGGWLM